MANTIKWHIFDYFIHCSRFATPRQSASRRYYQICGRHLSMMISLPMNICIEINVSFCLNHAMNALFINFIATPSILRWLICGSTRCEADTLEVVLMIFIGQLRSLLALRDYFNSHDIKLHLPLYAFDYSGIYVL